MQDRSYHIHLRQVCLRPRSQQPGFVQAVCWGARIVGVLCNLCSHGLGQANVPCTSSGSTSVIQVLADSPSLLQRMHSVIWAQSCRSVHRSIAVTPVGLDTSAAVLEGRVRAEKLFRNNYPSLPLGPDKQHKRSHCRERSTRVSVMARPAGRLASLLQSQSAGAKAAIEAHLAPAVAKGSVHSHLVISLVCYVNMDEWFAPQGRFTRTYSACAGLDRGPCVRVMGLDRRRQESPGLRLR